MKRYPIFFLIILLIGISCKKDTSSKGNSTIFARLTENTYNSEGIMIITVPATKTVFTDIYGTATIGNIAAGTYDVYAINNGYGSGKKSVLLSENAGVEVEIGIEYGLFPDFVPQIYVLEPEAEMNTFLFPANDTVSFKIKVNNGKVGNEVVWKSDLDGVLGSSVIQEDLTSSINFVGLSTGEHTLTLTTKGSDGFDGVRHLNIRTDGPEQLRLYPLEIESFRLKLTWSFFGNDDFTYYAIFEKQYHDDGSTSTSSVKTISLVYDTTASILINNNYDCEYFVKAYTNADYRTSVSNKQFFGKKYFGESFEINCQDIFLHKFKDYAYMIYNNKVILYDYENRVIVASRLIPNITRYFDVKYENNKLVLYLASDFQVYILDGEDLSIKETINFPNSVASVISITDNLIFTSVKREYSYTTVYSYSISQARLIDSIGYNDYSSYHLLRSPTDTKIILVDKNYPAYMKYLNYNSDGEITGYGNSSATDNESYGFYPWRFSPNGSYFISMYYDSEVFTTDEYLTRVGTLSYDYNFVDISFSPNSDTIFGLVTDGKKLFVTYSYPELEVINEIEIDDEFLFTRKKGNDFYSMFRVGPDAINEDCYFLKCKPQ